MNHYRSCVVHAAQIYAKEAIILGALGTKSIRNVVLVGHGSAGKTSLAEAMLYTSKATTRLGDVDAGQSILDYDAEEIKRKYTINLSLGPIFYKDTKINIIDTPGYADFIGDAIAGMYAAEMALFVIDAVSGPQVITDRLWKIAGEMGIARAFFINKLDKENATFDRLVAELQRRYGDRVIPVQVPIGRQSEFKGVVDIMQMKAMLHDSDGDHLAEIPDDIKEICAKSREALADKTAEADEELLVKYLDGEELTQDDLEKLVSIAIAEHKVVPVYVGSSTTLDGIEGLLNEIVAYFPYPKRHDPFLTTDGREIPAASTGEFSGQVFKTLSDPYVGRLSFIKVVSGEIKAGADVINSRTGKKERLSHILTLLGKTTEPYEGTVPPGDIIVVPKLMETLTNDTLSTKGDVEYLPMPIPEPLYPVALAAKTKADEDKLGSALKTIIDEDPTLTLRRDEETHQTIISGPGDTAIDVLISRLADKYHIDAEIIDLRIPYRETVLKTASAQGRHKKQSGGSGQFGDCWLRVEPNPGGGYEFLDEIVGGKIPRQYIPAVDRGIQETMVQGALAGYPVVDVKVAAFDGSSHPVDSNEMAFRTAARIGFRAACELASPIILEPMADLEVTVPDSYAGAVMSDVASIRGRVSGMDTAESGEQIIKITAPYAEVVHFSPHLRSLSHGTGSYTIELNGYEQVPAHLQQKIEDEHEAARVE